MGVTRLIIFTLAAGLLCIAVSAYISSKNYENWEATDGQLHYAYLHNASSPTKGGASDFGLDFSRVSYSYNVGDESYSGNRVMPLEHVYIPRDFVLALKPGGITVSYNPKNPAQAFLYAISPSTQIMSLLFVAILCTIFALLLPKIKGWFINAISST